MNGRPKPRFLDLNAQSFTGNPNMKNSTDSTKMAQVLPFEARAILARAAQTPIPVSDPNTRVRAIEEAQAKVRLMFPGWFR